MSPNYRGIERNYRERIEHVLKRQKASGGEPLCMRDMKKWVKPASHDAIRRIITALMDEKLVREGVVIMGRTRKVPGWEWIGTKE